MFTSKRKIMQAVIGAIAVMALLLSVLTGATPAAHAASTYAAPARIVPPCSTPTNPDCGEHPPGQYPAGDYGPGGACCYGQSGTWFDGGGVGLIGREVWTYANGATQDSYAGWNPAGLTPGTRYYVAAYIPDNHATAKAQYTVHALGGARTLTIDQSQYTSAWVPLGTYCPDNQGHIVVNLSDAGDSYPQEVGADAMHFEPAGSCSTTTPGGNPPPPPSGGNSGPVVVAYLHGPCYQGSYVTYEPTWGLPAGRGGFQTTLSECATNDVKNDVKIGITAGAGIFAVCAPLLLVGTPCSATGAVLAAASTAFEQTMEKDDNLCGHRGVNLNTAGVGLPLLNPIAPGELRTQLRGKSGFFPFCIGGKCMLTREPIIWVGPIC